MTAKDANARTQEAMRGRAAARRGKRQCLSMYGGIGCNRVRGHPGDHKNDMGETWRNIP